MPPLTRSGMNVEEVRRKQLDNKKRRQKQKERQKAKFPNYSSIKTGVLAEPRMRGPIRDGHAWLSAARGDENPRLRTNAAFQWLDTEIEDHWLEEFEGFSDGEDVGITQEADANARQGTEVERVGAVDTTTASNTHSDENLQSRDAELANIHDDASQTPRPRTSPPPFSDLSSPSPNEHGPRETSPAFELPNSPKTMMSVTPEERTFIQNWRRMSASGRKILAELIVISEEKDEGLEEGEVSMSMDTADSREDDEMAEEEGKSMSIVTDDSDKDDIRIKSEPMER